MPFSTRSRISPRNDWKRRVGRLACLGVVASQSFAIGGPSSYYPQGSGGPPPPQYPPPPGQYPPPPGHQGMDQQGSYPPGPPQNAPRPPQGGPPPGQYYDSPPPPSQGYDGPPPPGRMDHYAPQQRMSEPPGSYYPPPQRPPQHRPQQQQQQGQEGGGFFSRLKSKLFETNEDTHAPPQRSGPPYGQRLLPPAGPPGSGPSAQQRGAPYGGPTPPSSSSYMGPGMPSQQRPSRAREMGTPPEEGVGGLFGRLKAKLIGEEPLINQPVPPPPGPVPDFLQRRRAQYIYQDHPIGNDPSRYAGGPMGQQDMGRVPPGFQQGMSSSPPPPPPPPPFEAQYGAPTLRPDMMPPIDLPKSPEEEIPDIRQTEDGSCMVILRPYDLERKKMRINHEGVMSLQVVCKFDGVLTKFKWGSPEHPQFPTLTTAQLIEEMTTPDVAMKIRELRKEYQHQLQNPEADGAAVTDEHLRKLVEILGASNTNFFTIQNFVQEYATSLSVRDGCDRFLKSLCWKNVPLSIFSPGFGDVILHTLLQQTSVAGPGGQQLLPNIKIFSNFFTSSYDGRIVGTYPPAIYDENCNLTAASKLFPDKVQPRPNLLVIGSDPEGFNVAPGFPCHEIISAGFMERTNSKLFVETFSKFATNYDIVIIGDGSFDVLSDMVEDIIGRVL